MNYGMLPRDSRPVTRKQRSMCEAGAMLHTIRNGLLPGSSAACVKLVQCCTLLETAIFGAQRTLGWYNNINTICCTQHISMSQEHVSHPYQSAFSTILYNGNVTNKSGLLQLQGAVQGIPLGPLTNQITLLA